MNKLGKEETSLVEERKTIERLKVELRNGLESIWVVRSREQTEL